MCTVKPLHFELPMAAPVHGFVLQWSSGSFLIFLGDSPTAMVDVLASAMKTPYDAGLPSASVPIGVFGSINSDFCESEAKRLAHLYNLRHGASVPVYISISTSESDPLFYSAIRARLKQIVDSLAAPKDVPNTALVLPKEASAQSV